MTKLRLIKPWDLRIVRQKLNGDLRIFGAETINMRTCQAPSGVELTARTSNFRHRQGIVCNSDIYNNAVPRTAIGTPSMHKTVQ